MLEVDTEFPKVINSFLLFIPAAIASGKMAVGESDHARTRE